MGAIATLYKVYVVYAGDISGKKLTGSLGGNGDDLASLMRVLASFGYHCKFKNGKDILSQKK